MPIHGRGRKASGRSTSEAYRPPLPIGTPGPATRLHTHVAVANKVQTLDGRWLSIDGRVLFKANVAASETYNTGLEQHLRETLGVVRRTARHRSGEAADPEIVGVDAVTEPALVDPPRPHRDP